MTATRIRRAEGADWPAVADLHARSWAVAYRGIVSDAYLDGPVRADREAVWRDRLAGTPDPRWVVVVAEEAGALVALACIRTGADPVHGGLIDNLHVRPDRTGAGWGGRVLAGALDRLAPTDAAKPLHLTVYERNVRARAVYERWGGRHAASPRVPQPDGGSEPVRLYVWATAAALRAGLRPRG